MPRLAAGFFAIKFGKTDATAIAEKRIKEHGFSGPEIREARLFFLPRYFFEYCVVIASGENSKKVVDGFSSGKALFDPVLKELVPDSQVSALEADRIAYEFEEEIDFKVFKEKLKKSDAKKIAKILLSKEKKVPLSSLQILGFSLVFLPVWHFRFEEGRTSFEIEVNACTGALREIKPIPFKESSWNEAFGETFADLRNPKKWFSYLSLIPKTVYGFFEWLAFNPFLRRTARAVWKNRDLQIAILLVILAVLVLLFLSST
ncbi:MAG: hypothetical protein QXK06_01060 [Candidatus Diapherotrites archaeon]